MGVVDCYKSIRPGTTTIDLHRPKNSLPETREINNRYSRSICHCQWVEHIRNLAATRDR